FIASAEVIALLGLKPVMVDVDYNDFIATAKNIELAITSKTKAIIPVHLFGQGANMEEIIKIAEKYDLYIIEDNAQALGADYIFSDNRRQKLGTIGHIGCTSFFPSKNLGCYGDGGALFTNDDALAEKISMICNHGMKIRYHHEILGVNSRLDAIQAGILDVKLRQLNSYCKSRQDVARAYSHVLKDIDELICPIEREYSTHVYHQYTLKVLNNKRDELREYLDKNGITSMIYYPIPLNRQEAFTGIASMAGDMSVSDKLSSEVLSLPIHTEMNLKTIHYISTKIREFFSK
ncbi:MAG: DegT/DnrJ/EryC1/StrS family aminotransferase, partial [Bacteroidales bacterium]|nr:DegT/DnrJ/EryC1/StrS family aminotransferase [Bacteroidales bacterium]